MRVTGWTSSNNVGKYRDILDELIEAKSNYYINTRELRSKTVRNAYEVPIIKELNELVIEVENTVIEDVRKNGYKFSGLSHQNATYGIPIIDDTYVYYTSCRKWHWILAKAYDKETDYMDDPYIDSIYVYDIHEADVKIPDKSLWR